jgi:hypothetical protein
VVAARHGIRFTGGRTTDTTCESPPLREQNSSRPIKGVAMTESTRDARVRRLARRKDLKVSKARANRYPWSGNYFVSDPTTRTLLSSEFGMHLSDAEEFVADWQWAQ